MQRSVTWFIASIALLAALAASGATQELERNRALWNAAGIENYVYAYQKFCECHPETPPETVVDVRGGRIMRVHHEHPGSDREVPAREGSRDLYWTIDDLFALLANAEDAGADVRARYDADLGLPRELHIDYDPDLVGDEVDLRITRFDERAR